MKYYLLKKLVFLIKILKLETLYSLKDIPIVNKLYVKELHELKIIKCGLKVTIKRTLSTLEIMDLYIKIMLLEKY